MQRSCCKQPQMECSFRDAPLLQVSPEGGLFCERVACSRGWMQALLWEQRVSHLLISESPVSVQKFTAQGGPCLRAPIDDSIPREALCPAAPDRRQGLERDEDIQEAGKEREAACPHKAQIAAWRGLVGLDVRSSAISFPGLGTGGRRNILKKLAGGILSLQERVMKGQRVGCLQEEQPKESFSGTDSRCFCVPLKHICEDLIFM